MAQSILIGPVPGLPASDSISFIVTEILDQVPDGVSLYSDLAESFAKNDGKGVMLVHLKPHREEDIDDLFIPLARQTQAASASCSRPIPCRKVDRDFEMGDNEGDIPCTPVLGPRQGPPTLFEHEPDPDREGAEEADRVGW